MQQSIYFGVLLCCRSRRPLTFQAVVRAGHTRPAKLLTSSLLPLIRLWYFKVIIVHYGYGQSEINAPIPVNVSR